MPEVFGREVPDLPEGYVALEVAIVVKALDDEGEVSMLQRFSPDLNSWEACGMLDIAHETLRLQVVNSFVMDDEEDDY